VPSCPVLDQSDPVAARAVVVSAPFESTLSLGQGVAGGPAAILRALAGGGAGPRLGRVLSQVHLARPLDFSGLSLKASVEAISDGVSGWLGQNKFVLLIGGEHTASLGATRAHQAQGASFGVLYLDAHADLRAGFDGQRLSHACVARRMVEDGLEVVGLGWRSYSSLEYEFWRRSSVNVFLADDLKADRTMLDRAVEELPEQVYVSLDLDVLDPAVMPATCVLEPNGLSLETVNALLEKVFEARRVIGADLVEFSPLNDRPQSDLVAAWLASRFLELGLAQTGPGRQPARPDQLAGPKKRRGLVTALEEFRAGGGSREQV